MKKFIRLIVCLLIISLFSNSLKAYTYYIDPEFGTGDGISWDEACWSLEELIANWGPLIDGDIILIAKGDVFENSSFSSTSAGIVIDSDFIISGTITITGGVDNPQWTTETPSIDYTLLRVETPGSGGTAERIFHIDASGCTINISDITIQGGDISANGNIDSGYGGGIFVESGTLNLNTVVVKDSKSYKGGGIYNASVLKIENSTIQ